MFKKRANKRSNIRRRNDEEEEQLESAHTSDSNHDDSSTNHLSQIQQKKKRRMILESLQYRKGVNAAKLLQQQINPVEQLGDYLTVTADDPREGVLEQKHRQAMEAYIAENLGSATTTQHDKETKVVHNATEQLYAELSEAAMRLAGRSSVDDVGGTMAGTSLAEVVLPVEERMAALEETARATKVKDGRTNLPAASKASINSAVPNRFAAPARPKVLYDATTTALEQEAGFMDETGTTSTSDDAPDNDRVGFHAFRRQQNGEIRALNNSHERGGHRATDDRAFKNFVTKQRERRQNR
ncbi:hypothetical protein FisN_8Hh254 [Fistulifera solaris]|uniref:Hepatocellular carcinoma-associated antigen 59-domain-containing protein n=1 Tax=Fistulifera solaris TaxID=1519565 RepID=A0A1Z5JZ44_FISSO|nr:hypothetical protein FisN_8Hh254 [Fistulifera solaris]|eukprot:GAX19031.1 hypothetical protein FisN_8Hh254 [Fistulifera solaris]